MSTATDLAAIDAAIAENELAEDEAARLRELIVDAADLENAVAIILADREPAPAPAAAAKAEPEEPTEKQWRDLARENERHSGKVREIMGGFVDGFGECEACQGVGLVPPGDPEPEVKSHEWFKACETCNGYGQVRTGALNPSNATRECPACRGRGYLEAIAPDGQPLAEGGQLVTVPPPPTSTVAPATVAAGPNGTTPEPTFGAPSWMGDPNLGK